MVIATSPHTDNPLLRGDGFPPFDQIEVSHVEPAVRQLLQELTQELETLEQSFTPTWEGLVEPLERLSDRLGWTWGIVSHLTGVKNSPELRQAYEAVQPQVVEFYTRLGQSRPLYEGFKALAASPDFQSYPPARKRIVEAAIRNAEHSGVSLTGAAKERFNTIQLELAELSTQFSNNLLDATKAFRLKLTQPDEVAGLPPSLLALAAQTARQDGIETATPETGPWHITLDFPSFGPFMQHSQRRDLREQVYRAYISRASSGEWDNRPILERILALRIEEAQLLGFNTYAELSLASKMADSVASVEKLLEELRQVSYRAAAQELEELKAFAAAQGAPEATDLQHWDIPYWAERQREARFDFNDEELRPYFPLPQVLEGLFGLVKRLFGVTVVPADGQVPVWHPDVRFFAILDENHLTIAHFYLDPYSRPAEKRGGAWMDDCLGRAKYRIQGEWRTRLPVAYLVCNQTPPVDGKPSLMTFSEVETLFHEFGHGLHHMLTRVDEMGAAGINNVEWDAVELPSQFMENWCYHRPTLFGMARHYETGEPLPEHYYEKLVAARTYRAGSALLRQLHFSLLDLELHHRYQSGQGETPQQVRDRLAQTTTILPPLPEDAFLCSFSHIFAGGYAAGYYSYLWAEVLSADAFAAFEEAGLDNEQAIAEMGRRYRETVLALGGSQPPMEIFKAFRGREPITEPLLRHRGLLSNT
ncbi:MULTISPECIES: M3 family metallopeptidase [unclassified Thermosynechococcus]|uniref:M3 family metallopeptidase n=1 Tax=unclassified Thermosynechococcus TaxID=2622553 RepID=UPI002872F86D|nr:MULTISPECIES: M3 family metallopeptidase [unclassified Thermosynechococcus]WNC33181.1 M3 family metallopeptidase [Thermosynechococcus sp. PKX95]WNC35705.1 M3 family metallopeptidase [Thermosynechococcus sp. PKX91]WNC38229.1 M3 family metallopeptidase [Thermosynechococcus sp. WL11]WNC40748.1 M3 family metallopeptidase [Thermosynechococcus sp. WL17]WNC43268.1 M3 family metallopeptidase [Thermosynechococcus sp. WL15]